MDPVAFAALDGKWITFDEHGGWLGALMAVARANGARVAGALPHEVHVALSDLAGAERQGAGRADHVYIGRRRTGHAGSKDAVAAPQFAFAAQDTRDDAFWALVKTIVLGVDAHSVHP